MDDKTGKKFSEKVHRWRTVFFGIEGELEKIPAETEREFLALSSLLHSSYERTWVIADLFSSILPQT